MKSCCCWNAADRTQGKRMNNLSPLAPLQDVIRQRRLQALKGQENRRLLFMIIRMLAGMAIAVIVFLWLFGFRVVEGNGMYPALHDGDLTLTYSKTEYIKGDIIFYTAGGKEYCGRVVAKGGDVISYSDDGKFSVNGTVQTTGVAFPTYAPEGFEGRQTVPDDAVYVLGDYRTQTLDSRNFGCIPLQNVRAKMIAVLRHKVL